MLIAAFDIETIPNEQLPEAALPKFKQDVRLKDPLKIEAAEEKFKEGLIKKMSISPNLCRVCTFVGTVHDTDTGHDIMSESVSLQLTNDDFDPEEPNFEERGLVSKAWDWITKIMMVEKIMMVSYNGVGFDIPVMTRRALLLDLPSNAIPHNAFYKLTKRYGRTHHYDIMQELAGWQRDKWESMDYYLALFGIQKVMTGWDGSMVHPAFQNGDFDKIQAYCEDDVRATIELFTRMRRFYPPEGKVA